jgi:hypothetical protein
MGAVQCKEACDAFARELEARSEANRGTGQEQGDAVPWYSDVRVDSNGCRIFPPLPPAGQHPRLLFTESEVPALVARHTHTHLRGILSSNARAAVEYIRRYHENFSSLSPEERAHPGRKTLDAYFTKDETRNNHLLTAYVHAFVTGDGDLQATVREAVLFYANVVVKSAELARAQDIREKPYDTWHTSHYDMTTSFLFGGAPFALLYDVLHGSLSEAERALVRQSISLAVAGRRAWGMGWPSRRIQSNWAPYHGDLLVLAAAIEGEEGSDEEVTALFEDLMLHFLDFSIYDSGHPIEDAYCVNLALREGSSALLVMARRGYNLFARPAYINVWRKWMPFALEPDADGGLYGGSSGSSLPYPTAAFVAKYMYPKDPVVDFVYRHYMREHGVEYRRMGTSQTRWAAALYALPALNEAMCPRTPAEDLHDATHLGLPKTFHCNDRGKVIMRSDWTQRAICFTLDARPDGFLIGHDTASRGAFVLSACGRRWADCPEWNLFKESSDYSLVSIDGVGQEAKAPFVTLLTRVEGRRESTYAAADLTYAANYTWTQWAKGGVDMAAQGWEHEPHDPRHFGMTSWWLPNKIFDEPNVGFAGLHQWRKRFNTVARIARSTLMVRDTEHPFVVLCDDAVKDGDEHDYAWCMTTPADVTLLAFDGRDATLGERGGAGRRLLVRLLDGGGGVPVRCELLPFSKPDPKRKLPDGTPAQIAFARLRFTLRAKEAHFRIGFFPLPEPSSAPPATVWKDCSDDGAHGTLTVSGSTTVAFGTGSGPAKETTLRVVA